MEQDGEERPAPNACDVIKSGPFLGSIDEWVRLAAARSKPRFDEHMVGFERFIRREFLRFGIQPGNYEELLPKLALNGLVRHRNNESAKNACLRLLLRRPALNKPLAEAFRPPGRPPRTDLR